MKQLSWLILRYSIVSFQELSIAYMDKLWYRLVQKSRRTKWNGVVQRPTLDYHWFYVCVSVTLTWTKDRKIYIPLKRVFTKTGKCEVALKIWCTFRSILIHVELKNCLVLNQSQPDPQHLVMKPGQRWEFFLLFYWWCISDGLT